MRRSGSIGSPCPQLLQPSLFCKNAFVTDRNNAFVTTLSSGRRDEIQETCRRKLFPLSSSVTGGLGKADRSSGLERCHFYGRLRQAERADRAVAADLSTFCLPGQWVRPGVTSKCSIVRA